MLTDNRVSSRTIKYHPDLWGDMRKRRDNKALRLHTEVVRPLESHFSG